MDLLIQAFFIGSTSSILLANSIPSVRRTLIAYGPRSAPPPGPPLPQTTTQNSQLDTLLQKLSTLQVPHTYFYHFYILSTASSLFWAAQYLTNGALLSQICSFTIQHHPTAPPTNSTMSLSQIELAWSLLLLHSLRRLLESTLLSKPSKSKMWLGHYLVGLAFYLAMGIAIWIEGAEMILHPPSPRLKFPFPTTLKLILPIPPLLLASGLQHDAHASLASLPKYTLPTHPLFQHLLCPHYTAECVIYVCLAVLTAPEGQWWNRTVGWGVVFVMVNLGVTAEGVRGWSVGRFGGERVGGRWRMVPGVW